MEYLRPSGGNCYDPSGYITWFGSLPYINRSGGYDPSAAVISSAAHTNATAASFRVAVILSLLNSVQMSTRIVNTACSSNFGDDLDAPLGFDPASEESATMLECQLVNTTYTTAFDYVSGNQTVRIDKPRNDDEKKIAAVDSITGPTNSTCVGLHGGYLLDTTAQTDTRPEMYDWPERCDFDPYLARQLAYQSIMDAFYTAIAGNVDATTLLGSRELHFLTNYTRIVETNASVMWNNAQVALFDLGLADLAGLTVPGLVDQLPPLAQEMEHMFRNLTVSLMSSPAFQYVLAHSHRHTHRSNVS